MDDAKDEIATELDGDERLLWSGSYARVLWAAFAIVSPPLIGFFPQRRVRVAHKGIVVAA